MSEQENAEDNKSLKIFDKFIDVVINRISNQKDKQVSIPVFLRKKYKKADVKYTDSKDFQNMILEHLIDIKKKKGSIYTHIHEVVSMLTAAKQKTGNEESNLEQDKGESSEKTEGTSVENVKKNKLQRKKEKKQKRRIKRLELHLKELSKEIKRLAEKELTLDDMDDEESDHIMEHKLKLRFNRVWEKLCELKDVPASTGRVTEQYLIFEETRFKEINEKLEKLMNKSEFPNFNDVLEVVKKVNKKKGLNLSEREISNIAEKSFKNIGERLQQRREVDLAYNFGSHLTEDFKLANDPAKHDQELNGKLRDNHKLGEEKLDMWIKKYSEKQEMGEDGDESSKEEPSVKRFKIDESCESDDILVSEKVDNDDVKEDHDVKEDEEDEEENYEQNDLEEEFLLDELENSGSEEDDDAESASSKCNDDEELTTMSLTSSTCTTDDEQFLPEHYEFRHENHEEYEKQTISKNISANSSIQVDNTRHENHEEYEKLTFSENVLAKSSIQVNNTDNHETKTPMTCAQVADSGVVNSVRQVVNSQVANSSLASVNTQVASSSTDDCLMPELSNVAVAESIPSPQQVTSSTSPKHESAVPESSCRANSPELIILSSSDDESTESPPVAKRINHMFGCVKDIAPAVSSDDDDYIVLSD